MKLNPKPSFLVLLLIFQGLPPAFFVFVLFCYWVSHVAQLISDLLHAHTQRDTYTRTLVLRGKRCVYMFCQAKDDLEALIPWSPPLEC